MSIAPEQTVMANGFLFIFYPNCHFSYNANFDNVSRTVTLNGVKLTIQLVSKIILSLVVYFD